jgi:hypothetical protein
MKLLSAIGLVISIFTACNNRVSEEDRRDSLKVIRAADSMLKLEAGTDTLAKDGTIKDSAEVKDSLLR